MSPMEIMKNAEIERLKALITELADTMEKFAFDEDSAVGHWEVSQIIQRAREATK